MTLYVGISTDHSISMSSRRQSAHKDYMAFHIALKESAIETKQDIKVTHSMCAIGTGWSAINRFFNVNVNILACFPLPTYDTPGNCTPLWDSVYALIEELKEVSRYDVNAVFLVQVFTDGADNASTVSASKIKTMINQLQSTDRWTFVFRVPNGMKRAMVDLGIPSDNIQEWELSSAGLERSTVQAQSALRSYTSSVAQGATSTQKFFANLDTVSTTQVKAALRDISQEVLILPVSGAEGQQIRTFIETRLGKKYKKGAGFYQLTKTESAVQDYKKILIRDKTSNAIYEGAAARDLLGVPHSGNIKLAPSKHGNYDIFIQSTSVNRSLDKNTQLIYWENHDQVYVAPVLIPQVQVVKHVSLPMVTKTTPQALDQNTFSKTQMVPVKTAPKKRIRDRNTIQQAVRNWLRSKANSFVPAKKTINTVKLSDLGFDVQSLVDLMPKFEEEFKVSVTPSKWYKAKTVGDIVAFVE